MTFILLRSNIKNLGAITYNFYNYSPVLIALTKSIFKYFLLLFKFITMKIMYPSPQNYEH